MAIYNRVKDLLTWRSEQKIQVKVLKKWRKESEEGSTIHLILCDFFGEKIETTITPDLFKIFNNQIAENDWKIVSNFSVCYHERRLKHTQSDQKIIFSNDTIVENLEVVSNNHFSDFETIDRVFDGYHAVTQRLVDIMGEVINVEPMIHAHDPNVEVPYEIMRILWFSIRDLSGMEIHCVTYNETATFFTNNWLATGCYLVVAVLQFWHAKYQSSGQRIELYSSPLVSRIHFNPPVAEVQDFKMRLEYNQAAEDGGSD